MKAFQRRDFLKAIAASGSAWVLTVPAARAATKARVVVVGGGFGGATAAKYVRLLDPAIEVTLIERNRIYTACPLSNEVISGHRDLASLQTNYDRLAKRGIKVVIDDVTAIDPGKKTVATKGGKSLAYDALVVSPGVDFKWDAVQGYSEAVSKTVPHAYKAGEQTTLLMKQVQGMRDGGLCIIAVPPSPFRCPPGPYERAAQIAHYFKTHGKGKSKVLILDANDSFSKKALFEQGWQAYYPGMIEWVPGASDGKVEKLDAEHMTVFTGLEKHKADVINLIPLHTAGQIAHATGLTNEKGWCDIDPASMESAKQKGIYVIGDACAGGDLPIYPFPKSAHMAASQAKVAAAAIVARANNQPLPEPFYTNTCYSVVAPEHGFSVVHVYRVENGKFVYVKEAGGISPVNAPPVARKLEAEYAEGWLRNVMADAFA